jgi:hypothetical protein
MSSRQTPVKGALCLVPLWDLLDHDESLPSPTSELSDDAHVCRAGVSSGAARPSESSGAARPPEARSACPASEPSDRVFRVGATCVVACSQVIARAGLTNALPLRYRTSWKELIRSCFVASGKGRQ